MENRQAVLQFKDICFKYENDNTYIIQDLQFAVKEGEFVSIIGPSGCGKTTLFRLITGLENPHSGSIFIEGKECMNRLGAVGYMPQQDLLLPWRTVLENVHLPLEIKGEKECVSKEEIFAFLEEFGLQGYENKYPSKLSGGMKQRVSFLRTILTGANILLLDEPFSALDAITRLSMQEWLIEKWKKLKKTILFITHDVDEALLLSDRIFVITERPIRSFTEVKVPLKRPRKIRDLANADVVQLKEYLIEELRRRVVQP